jgi:polysaccharide biosynthesis protein PslH
VLPATTGNGLAMRAGTVLRLLAEHHEVCLRVLPLYAAAEPRLPRELEALCEDIAVIDHSLPLPRTRRVAWENPLRRRPRGLPEAHIFDVVHVFRLAMVPFARSWGGPAGPTGPVWHLDLDDVESVTRLRLAALYRSTGQPELAQREQHEADRYGTLEATVLSDFDRVYVCSELDRERLRRHPRKAEVRVLPNALPIPTPAAVSMPRPRFTFLFVGTLGYYPNEDAVAYFCTEVLPRLRAAASGQFQVDVVGTGPSTVLSRLAGPPEVRVLGPVPSVAPAYGEADAVIVPVRGGGGTRIKVLEAFAFRRPVVSTSLGIEGIDAHPEEHVLIGDDPDAFARQCLRLLQDPPLRYRLAASAWSLFTRAYSIEAVARSGVVD